MRTERQLERACAAWKRGELERAASALEEVLERRPGLPEAIFPLSRVLHEQGKTPRALDLLEEAAADEGAGGAIHRALICFDSGDDGGLGEALESLGPRNQSGPAIVTLCLVRQGDWGAATFPPVALWNAEIVGRLLSLLESRLAEGKPPGDDTFHHRLFVAAPKKAGKNGQSPPGPAPRSWGREEWEAALEASFAAGLFARFITTWESDVPARWRDALSREYWVYSHYASSPPSRAVETAREALAAAPRRMELHFLHGLCLVRHSRPVEAAHAFVRAARLDDVGMNSILLELAGHVEVHLNVAAD
ncbi:MAG: tetratricopeptide repeat protein [Planctomycetota bacterium]|nr:tetratricopeptide repeat protein [Planctomycetota bacterium]